MKSYKSPGSLGLFTPPPYMPIKGAFVVFFVCKISKEKLSHEGSLGIVHDVKNREEGSFSWGVRKNLNTRFLVLRVWEERIN